jgi:hypothetical protein
MVIGQSGLEIIRTSYNREFCYNLEHCIRLQVQFKIDFNPLENSSLPASFGIG